MAKRFSSKQSDAARQQSHESLLNVTAEGFDATMKTNIYAAFWILRAAVPLLPPGAAIIDTTSEQAYDPSPELYDYAQTKAATTSWIKSSPSNSLQKASG